MREGKAKKQRPPPHGSGVIVEQLASGAKVLVRREPELPLCAMRAVFQGGLRYETDEDNGLTTLLARTLTRGNARLDAEEISRRVDELGGSLSASAGRNSMSLRGEFLSKNFYRAFSLDCLLTPAFQEGELSESEGSSSRTS